MVNNYIIGFAQVEVCSSYPMVALRISMLAVRGQGYRPQRFGIGFCLFLIRLVGGSIRVCGAARKGGAAQQQAKYLKGKTLHVFLTYEVNI